MMHSPSQAGPRPQHHRFANVTLRNDVMSNGTRTWKLLEAADPSEYLGLVWVASAVGASVTPFGLRVEPPVPRGDWEFLVVRLPDPERASEAFAVALARRPAAPAEIGYFVLEMTAAGGASVAEWQGEARKVLGDLYAPTSFALVEALFSELSTRKGAPFGGGALRVSRADVMAPRAADAAPAPRTRRGRSFFAAGVLVLFVGGLGAAAYFFGPDLVERFHSARKAKETESMEAPSEQKASAARDKLAARIGVLQSTLDGCKTREREAYATAAERAHAQGKLGTHAAMPPKDRARIQAAVVFAFPKDGEPLREPADMRLFPDSKLLAKQRTQCSSELSAALDQAKPLLDAAPKRGEANVVERASDYVALVDAKLRELERQPDTLEVKLARSVAFVRHGCTERSIATYTGTGDAGKSTLNAYACDMRVVWVAVPDGDILAVGSASASAEPAKKPEGGSDPGVIAKTNNDTQDKALERAAAALRSSLVSFGG